MKIRFETNIEHFVAFNRFHFEKSPMWRRQRLVATLIVPVVIGLLSLFFLRVSFDSFAGDPIAFAVFAAGVFVLFLVFSVPWIFTMRWRASAKLGSGVRKLLAEGTNRSVLGWCDMELGNNRLVVKRELIEASYDLRAIEKIVDNEEYTFVYFSSFQAFIIPVRLYPEDEYRTFVAELREAWEHRDDAPLPSEEMPDVRIAERKF